MVITFNFKDGTETITFADLEKSALGSDLKVSGAPRKETTFVYQDKGCFFSAEFTCRVDEIIFDDEIPVGEEIRLNGGRVYLIIRN